VFTTQQVKENTDENATLFNFSYTNLHWRRILCVRGNFLQQFVLIYLLKL